MVDAAVLCRAVSTDGEKLAGLGAGTGIAVPDTTRIGIALTGGGVGELALNLASVRDSVPHAHTVEGTGRGELETVARLSALASGVAPLAVGISIAGGGVEEAVLALADTLSESVIPLAHLVGKARRSVGLEGAVSIASLVDGVPDTGGVRVARGLGGVTVLATLKALLLASGGSVEDAHRLLGALAREVSGGGGKVVNGTAGTGAGSLVRVPHARSVGVTRVGS